MDGARDEEGEWASEEGEEGGRGDGGEGCASLNSSTPGWNQGFSLELSHACCKTDSTCNHVVRVARVCRGSAPLQPPPRSPVASEAASAAAVLVVRAMSFKSFWCETLWPAIQKQYGPLLERPQARQGTAVGRAYGTALFEQLKTQTVVRNVTCNLAWTDPAENTPLQDDISLSMVENWVLDFFMDPKMFVAAASASTEGEACEADSVPEDDRPVPPDGGVSAAQTRRDAVAKKPRVWKVPERVPQYCSIPIVVTALEPKPTKGKFRRYGMDCAVNGMWLALYWVGQDKAAGLDKAESAGGLGKFDL